MSIGTHSQATQTCGAARLLAAGLAIAVVVLFGCGGGDEQKPAKPAAPAQPTSPPPAKPTSPPVAPPAQAGGGDVGKIELGNAAEGAKQYAMLCSSCHGARGAGDGPVSAGLVPKPAAHNDGNYMNKLSNEHIFKVIKLGGASVGKSPLMAPWGGTLNDDQIRDVVAFVRSLANPPYQGS